MPEFFIHCGLHKTGTTALQHFLARNAQAFLDFGLHYPAAGRGSTKGHHNLAWQLSRDRRFIRRDGDLELMLRQVAVLDKDTVISSEDFETSLQSPERWAALVESIKSLGFSVTFIIYLREPAGYLQSLFLENIKHGCGDEFGAVARQVLERRFYSFNDWAFQFDYDMIGQQMARVSGARVVFRSFEHLVGGAILPDFLSVIGHTLPYGVAAAGKELNAQANPATLLDWFLRNRYSPQFPPLEHILAVSGMMLGARDVTPKMPHRLTEVFQKQLASKVKQAVDQKSAGEPRMPRRPKTGDWEVNISRLFSWETQVEALALCERAPGSGTDKIDALRSGDQGVFETWRNWVAGGL